MEELKEKIVSNEMIDNYLDKLKNPKHKTQILIMRDCGLRVTELVRLKWKHFDFRNRTLKIESLKKGKNASVDKKTRLVPISSRVFASLSELSEKVKPQQEDYLFPSAKRKTHIHRQSVNQVLTDLSKAHPDLNRIAPHDLRHTAISALVSSGGTPTEAQNFAGHNNFNTTAIYIHNDNSIVRAKLEESSRKKLTTFQKIKSQFLSKKPAPIIHISTFDNRFTIGREKELKLINSLLQKDISIILIGQVGAGKSHLLKNLKFLNEKKILKYDDTKFLKKSVLGTILALFEGDKEQAKNLIFEDKEQNEVEKLISKDSLPNLCKLLCSIVQPNEYVLIIDEVDSITPSVIKSLEILKEKFQIVTTAREVKYKNASFLSNFEKIDIKNLDRVESIRLIRRLASDLKIENWEHFQNHIYNSSEGNPRIIIELVDRARKEEYIDETFVEQISSNYLGRTIKEIDVAFPLLAATAVLLGFWIFTHSESISSMRLLRYALMVLVLFGRSILRIFQKNTL